MSSQTKNTQQGQQNQQGQASQQSPQPGATTPKPDFIPPHMRAKAGQSNTQQSPLPSAKPSRPDQNTAMGSPPQGAPKQAAKNAPSNTMSERPAQVDSSSAGLPIRNSSSGATSTLPIHYSPGHRGPSASAKSTPKDADQIEPELTFFDEEYAQAEGAGKDGVKIKIRVNRFDMPKANWPKKLYIMSFSLPKINGRAVTAPRVKKLLLQSALSAQQPWGAEATANHIFTDWNGTLISKKSVADLGGTFAVNADGSFVINVQFAAQDGAPASPTYQAKLSVTDVLDKTELEDYVAGKKALNFNHSRFTTAFNIMARHFAAQHAISVGPNKVFPVQQSAESWKCGLHPRLGFHNSVRPATNGLQLRVNTCGSAFYDSIDLDDFLEKYFGNQKFNRGQPNLQRLMADVRAVTKQLQVHLTYAPADATLQPGARSVILLPLLGRLKRVNGYGRAASRETFDHPNHPKPISVQYYFEEYVLPGGMKLQYPELPVVDVGSREKHVWVPMELLRIAPHQALRTQLRDTEMTRMAVVSRAEPLENIKRIEGIGLPLLQINDLVSGRVINVEQKMLQISGRMLPMPTLSYGHGSKSLPKSSDLQKGKWSLENNVFVVTASLSTFLVIERGHVGAESVNEPKFKAFAESLSNCGLKSVNHSHQFTRSFSDVDLSAALARAGKNTLRIILVVFDNKSDPNAYAAIKTWGETVAGIHTVCLTSMKLDKLPQPGFQANLALKFNAKLGGQNHRLDDKFYKNFHAGGSTMVVGADVTHPTPSSVEFCPSIAAVVASTDIYCVDYPGSMRLQQSRKEEISDMEQMMLERLDLWYKKNNELPTKILFYRDGVSEDQYAMVKRHELKAIRLACAAAGTKYDYKNYSPPITLVVCTKRHQDRFYQGEKKPSGAEIKYFDPGNKNFIPGLVVDDPRIRLPKYFDFWLQSHKSLQGTARPCHYFVLENGIGYSPDTLQGITFNLSWVYATALTPISMVAPAYYADKLCERGRCYIRPLLIGQHADHPSKNDMDALLGPLRNTHTLEQQKQFIVEHYNGGRFWPQNGSNPCHDEVKDTMFYI